MIHIENVRRIYGEFCAVDDVSFSIGQGEIVGLLGHNGAGKTTIMKMITGFLEPTSGTITIDKQNLDDCANNIQSQIGYLPENLPVYPEMTVIDYLLYCAEMRNIRSDQQETAAYTAIAKTQLQEKALEQISTLSRGFKQRVGVAQALIHNPKLLILDEPTNGLDPHQTQQMRELILNLAKDATVILSTHIMQEVEAICDRVIILNSGKLAIDQPLSNLQKVNTIHVTTDANYNELHTITNTLNVNIQTLKSDEISTFIVNVDSNADINTICKYISQHILASGKSLYALSPQRQSLETIFKNIHTHQNTHKEAPNAA